MYGNQFNYQETNIITGLSLLLTNNVSKTKFMTIYKRSQYTPYFKFMTVFDDLTYNLYETRNHEMSSDDVIVDLYFNTVEWGYVMGYALNDKTFDMSLQLFDFYKHSDSRKHSNIIKILNNIYKIFENDEHTLHYWTSVVCVFYCLYKLCEFPNVLMQDTCKLAISYMSDELKFKTFQNCDIHENTNKLKTVGKL